MQKLWRGVAVEGIDEKKVEEYLTKQGIASMQDTVQRVVRIQFVRNLISCAIFCLYNAY